MDTSTTHPGPEPETLPFAQQLEGFRASIDRELELYLDGKRRETREAAPEAVALVDALADLITAGGKRLRPALVHYSYLACGGDEPRRVLPLALASEILHAYLLVHDDIMDHAEVRRGRPTAHASFRQRHHERGWRGDAADHGRSVGILVGDLAASYAFDLLTQVEAEPEQRRRLERCFATMSQEVIHGQYLELLMSFEEAPTEADLRRVLQLKSGRYSVERPIQMGALAAAAEPEVLAALSRYGSALGEAFQLQDDLLGMFGDAETVGKPVGGDLAEGKFTFLIYHALEAASPEERAWLESVRGRPEAAAEADERVRHLIEANGALARVREMVARRLEVARESLQGLALAPEGRGFLEGLITYSQERRR